MAMERFDGIVQNSAGDVSVGVSVSVKVKATGVIATLYSDEGITARANPLTTDGAGRYYFYAAAGDYVIETPISTLERVTLYSGIAREDDPLKADDLPTKNNETNLEDDSTLVFTVAANETWEFTAILRITTAAAAGFDFKFTIPAGAVYTRKASWLWDGTTIRGHWNTALDTEDSYAGGVAALADDTMRIQGLIVNGATAGDVQFQYAQNVGDVSNTNVLTGSWMTARRIG